MPTLKDASPTDVSKISMRMSEAEFVELCNEEVRAEWVEGKVEIMNVVAADHAKLTMFITLLVERLSPRMT